MNLRVIEVPATDQPLERRRLPELPGRVVEVNAQHVYQTTYETSDGDFSTGVWTSTPGKWRAFSDRDEFCYIVEGHICLIGDDGHVQTFRTGEAFLIPKGFSGYFAFDWDGERSFASTTTPSPQDLVAEMSRNKATVYRSAFIRSAAE